MSNHIDYFERKCPVCGKTFYPLPEHVYTRFRKGKWLKFCSWTCFRKDEKEHPVDDRRRKETGY